MIHHIKPCRHMFVAREAGEDAFELTADLGGQSCSSKVPCAWKSYYSSCHPIIAGISSSSSTESYLPPLSLQGFFRSPVPLASPRFAMANPLAQLAAFLTPPPVNLSADYDGVEYKWKIFTFRPARMTL